MSRQYLLKLLPTLLVFTVLTTAMPESASARVELPKRPHATALAGQQGVWNLASWGLVPIAGVELALTRGFGRAAFGLSAALRGFAAVISRPVLAFSPIGGEFRTSSGFGLRRHPILRRRRMHHGIDFAAKRRTPVLSAGKGRVTFRGWKRGYGRLVIVDHGNGLTTRYAHLQRFRVRKGQKVKGGQKIGLVGSSGRATGPHLHFEVRIDGRSVDPTVYVGFQFPDDHEH